MKNPTSDASGTAWDENVTIFDNSGLNQFKGVFDLSVSEFGYSTFDTVFIFEY
jgi:hypothetical protein